MNILKRIGRHVNLRCLSSKASSTSPFIVEKLDKRSLIRVQGAEVVPFLQGLITNDMNHLKQHSHSVYTMFLNKAGKVLYDSIIYRTSEQDTYLIECDKVITQDLEKHLRLFRVRRKIDVEEVSTDYNIWVMFKNRNPTGKIEANSLIPQEGSVALKEGVDDTVEGIPPEMKNVPEEALICNDPRLKELGARLIVPSSLEMTSIQKLFPKIHVEYSTETNDYKSYRYRLGVAEGVDELPPGKCFPLESNCDYLHGVSFHKGCYIGQELTARTHHTGVIRKRIMPFCSEEDIDQASEVIEMPNRKVVGKIRGIKNNFGIGLIRIEQALQSVSLFIGSVATKVVIPEWWPKELPSKATLKIKQL